LKKTFILICAVALIGTAGFAQTAFSMSAGVAGLFATGANSAVFTGKVHGADLYDIKNTAINAGGVAAFFDATYGEFSVNVLFPATNTLHAERNLAVGKKSESTDENAVGLGFALLGKYPIALGPVSAFPLVGVDYTLDFADIGNSKVGLDFGLGADVPFSIFGSNAILDKLYIRVQALYALHFVSPSQRDAESEWKDQESPGYVYSDLETVTSLTHGVQFKLGVGYKF
jgi:hypothetical protein